MPFNFLKNHPFSVAAYFDRSLVLTFAVPADQLQLMIPSALQLDTFQDQWAFMAVAMVQTQELRPKGLPKFMGNDFFLIGYRIFVRYRNKAGKRLRGLYIIKSETDSKKMQFLGNIFTHYNYSTTDIEVVRNDTVEYVKSEKSNFKIEIDRTKTEAQLPDKSPFSSWKEARRFAGPLPFTFTCNPERQTVLIIEGVRSNWKPRAVPIKAYHLGFLNQLNLKGAVLASAFEVVNVPYYWKKGKLEQWN